MLPALRSLHWLAPHTYRASSENCSLPLADLEHCTCSSLLPLLVGPVSPLVPSSKSVSTYCLFPFLPVELLTFSQKLELDRLSFFCLFPRSSRQVAVARRCYSGWPQNHPKMKTPKSPQRQSQMCPSGPATSCRRTHPPWRGAALDSWSNGWSKRRGSQWPSDHTTSSAGLGETRVTACCTIYCCWQQVFALCVSVYLFWEEVAQCKMTVVGSWGIAIPAVGSLGRGGATFINS